MAITRTVGISRVGYLNQLKTARQAFTTPIVSSPHDHVWRYGPLSSISSIVAMASSLLVFSPCACTGQSDMVWHSDSAADDADEIGGKSSKGGTTSIGGTKPSIDLATGGTTSANSTSAGATTGTGGTKPSIDSATGGTTSANITLAGTTTGTGGTKPSIGSATGGITSASSTLAANRNLVTNSVVLPPADEIVVRTTNAGPDGPCDSSDANAIMQAIQGFSPNNLGFLNLQECEPSPDAAIWSTAASQIFGSSGCANPSATNAGNLTQLWCSPWEKDSDDSWVIGEDSAKYRTFPYLTAPNRYMKRVRLCSKELSRCVSVYTLHLSHNPDQHDNRTDEINNVTEQVLCDANRRGDLLPIVVGDFNFSESDEPDNYALMNSTFEQLTSNGFDHIWVGRPDLFPNNGGTYEMTSDTNVDTGAQYDHNAVMAALKVHAAEPAAHWLAAGQVLGDGPDVHTNRTLVGDVNHDGRADLVFVGQNWSGTGLNVRTKISNGDGTWTAHSQVLGDGPDVHSHPTLIGDINHDGRADLVFVGQNWSGAGLNIRSKLSNGDGTWTAYSQVLGDGPDVHSHPTLIGDINHDGRADLVFVGQNWSGAGLNIRSKLSNGDGTWTAYSQALGDGPDVHTYPTLMGDVNGDGRADLIFVGQNWSGTGLNIRTKLSNGDGTWAAYSQVLGDGPDVHTHPTLIGDVNGDGRADLVFVGQNWGGAGLNIRTKISNGDGTWTAHSQVLGDGPGVFTYPTLIGDVNGDGRADLIFLLQDCNGLNIRVKYSQGNGTWLGQADNLGDGSGVNNYPTLIDHFDGDARADLVFVGQDWSGAGLNIRTKFSRN